MKKFAPVHNSALTEAPYDLISLADERGVLTLSLEGASGKAVSVRFDGYVFYSKMDEGDALHTLGVLRQASCIGFVLISARDSELLDWFNKESFGVRLGAGQFTHYILLTQNDIVNVISIGAPSINCDPG